MAGAVARLTKARRRLLLAAVAVALAWPLVAWGAARALVVRADMARADALAVLSGAGDYEERTRRAAALWREGRAPKIILTDDGLRGGWSVEHQRNLFFVERAAEELRRAGVPAECIEVVPGVRVTSTYDEALALRDHARARGLKSLLVVTSSYHSRRALWTLRRVFRGGGTEVGLDAAPPGPLSPTPATWWCQARGWRAVALEYPKQVYYWLRYR